MRHFLPVDVQLFPESRFTYYHGPKEVSYLVRNVEEDRSFDDDWEEVILTALKLFGGWYVAVLECDGLADSALESSLHKLLVQFFLFHAYFDQLIVECTLREQKEISVEEIFFYAFHAVSAFLHDGSLDNLVPKLYLNFFNTSKECAHQYPDTLHGKYLLRLKKKLRNLGLSCSILVPFD